MTTKTAPTLDTLTSTCPNCAGLRYLEGVLCPVCNGEGMIIERDFRPVSLGLLWIVVGNLLLWGAVLWVGRIVYLAVKGAA